MHSRRAVAIHRSQIAFARGAWIGVLIIVMPATVKTASNAPVYVASRSLIKPQAVGSFTEVHERVPGLLHCPGGGRVGGDAGQVHAPMVVLDDEQHVEPAQEDGVDMEEVDRGDRLGLGGQKLFPAGARALW